MKHKKHNDNGRTDGPQLVPVRFEFKDPTAVNVGVAGTFNKWQPGNRSMLPIGSGHWLKETNLSPGTYEYCLVVDGRWMPDPLARESVPNPYGGRNSVLKVFSSSEAAHRSAAVNLPMKNTANRKPNKI